MDEGKLYGMEQKERTVVTDDDVGQKDVEATKETLARVLPFIFDALYAYNEADDSPSSPE